MLDGVIISCGSTLAGCTGNWCDIDVFQAENPAIVDPVGFVRGSQSGPLNPEARPPTMGAAS